MNTAFDMKQLLEQVGTTLRKYHGVIDQRLDTIEDYLLEYVEPVQHLGLNTTMQTKVVSTTPLAFLAADADAMESATMEGFKRVADRCTETTMAIEQWRNADASAHEQLASFREPEPHDNDAGAMHEQEPHGNASAVFMSLVRRGLGACITELCAARREDVDAVLAVVETAKDSKTEFLSEDDVKDIPGGAPIASIFASLLANTGVRSVGIVPLKAAHEDAITEVNLTSKVVGLCEAGLLAHYFNHNAGCEPRLRNIAWNTRGADKNTHSSSRRSDGRCNASTPSLLLSFRFTIAEMSFPLTRYRVET